jgi:hypothetical protein
MTGRKRKKTRSDSLSAASAALLPAAVVAQRLEHDREEGAVLCIEMRAESARMASRIIHGIGIRTPVRPEPLDLELRLPMTATRGELATVLEEIAKTLRDPEL